MRVAARGGAGALQRTRPRRGARGGARGSFEQCSASTSASSSAAQRQWPLWSCAAAGGPVRRRRSVGSGRAVGSRAGCRVSLAGEKRQGLPCILGDAQLCAMRLLRRWAASMRSAARGVGGFSGAVVGQRRGARAPRALLNDRKAWAGDLSLSGAQLCYRLPPVTITGGRSLLQTEGFNAAITARDVPNLYLFLPCFRNRGPSSSTNQTSLPTAGRWGHVTPAKGSVSTRESDIPNPPLPPLSPPPILALFL